MATLTIASGNWTTSSTSPYAKAGPTVPHTENVLVTVNTISGGAWFSLGSESNCTLSATSGSSGSVLTVNPTAAGTYVVNLSCIDGNLTSWYCRITGTANNPITAPTTGTISFANTTAVPIGGTVTVNWTANGAPSYFNSSGNVGSNQRWSPKDGTLSTTATSGSFTATAVGTGLTPGTAYTSPSAYDIRSGSLSGTVLGTSANKTIYNPVTAPNTPSISFSSATSATVSATGGEGGTLQYALGTTTSPTNWQTSATFTVVGNTTYYALARRTWTYNTATSAASAAATSPPSAPTDITQSDPGTASSSVSITLTASGGSGGTLQVSINGSTWSTSPAAFTMTRGTAYTVYARRTGATGTSATYSEAYTPPYLAADLTVTATSSTIAWDATSASTTVASGATNNLYAVRLNNGSTNLGTRTGNGAISFTSSLPAEGATTTYEIFGQLPVASGGNGTYAQTNVTFTVTRDTAPLATAPTSLSFSVATTAAASTNVTVTAAGGTNGTMEVSEDNTNWFANGTAFSKARGSSYTFYGRTVGVNTSSSYSDIVAVPYLTPDVTVSATSSVILKAATSATTTVSNGSTTDTYAARLNNGGTDLATRTGNGAITFTSSLPTAGNITTYEIFARRPTSTGGDGTTYYQTNITFTVERNFLPSSGPISLNADIGVAAGLGAGATTSIDNASVRALVGGAAGATRNFSDFYDAT